MCAQLLEQSTHGVGTLATAHITFQDNVDAAKELGILTQVCTELG